ncbi:MAG: iron ABC transporter permease [Geobacteraceae bacterium]|nr:iron ABC transporter permease [Geobacteraceae bacterium]
MVTVKTKRKRTRQPWLIVLSLIVVLIVSVIVTIGIGRYDLSPLKVFRILLGMAVPLSIPDMPPWRPVEWGIVSAVRLPRILVTAFAGMGLAISGAALQGLFRNPLVGPQIIGISSGASFGGVLGILLSLPAFAIVGFAFSFGLLSLVLVFLLSRLASRAGSLSLVLSGVICSSFFAALLGLMQYLADPELQLPNMVYWLMGSFAWADWRKVAIIGIPSVISGIFLILLRWRINLLSLGDTDASVLGVKVGVLRWSILVLVTFIVAAQVSVSGGVGWVGLVTPHFARMLVGPDHRVLLPASALLGGIFLLLIDCLARTLTMQEIPIGVLTALVGTPVFGYLFWKTQARGWTHD